MTTKKKKTAAKSDLAQYNKTAIAAATAPPVMAKGKHATRGAGVLVATTIRLSRPNWIKLRTLAMNQGVTLQTLVLNACNRELQAAGVPLLDA